MGDGRQDALPHDSWRSRSLQFIQASRPLDGATASLLSTYYAIKPTLLFTREDAILFSPFETFFKRCLRYAMKVHIGITSLVFAAAS